jgi:hypothetical protein
MPILNCNSSLQPRTAHHYDSKMEVPHLSKKTGFKVRKSLISRLSLEDRIIMIARGIYSKNPEDQLRLKNDVIFTRQTRNLVKILLSVPTDKEKTIEGFQKRLRPIYDEALALRISDGLEDDGY